jgi:hypothetical protein
MIRMLKVKRDLNFYMGLTYGLMMKSSKKMTICMAASAILRELMMSIGAEIWYASKIK